MKVLVVEDDQNRIVKFKRDLVGHDVDYAEDAGPAINFINNNTYDLIFLDHDLGGETYVPSSNRNTGYQVAKAIKKTSNESAYIIIHSCNTVGAYNIKAELPKAILAPFTILDIKGCVGT